MIDKTKKQWDNLPAEKKRIAVIGAVVGIIIVLSVGGYYATRSEKPVVSQKAVNTKKEISLEPKLLEKTYMAESTKQIEALKQEFADIKKQMEEEKRLKEAKEAEMGSKANAPQMPPVPPPMPHGQPAVPPPPSPPSYTQNTETPADKPAPVIEIIGDIEVVSHQVKVQTEAEDNKKKEGVKIYLPPSFMEATLLSGLDAPAVGDGKGNPVPVLLRVKDIAVLPNKVKANLKGCFVIADGNGSLADERAHLRLVSLSCIAKNGEAVIDQDIKGFVVDSDGKIGLRGRVVSKMGSAIARSFLAGMFGGIGDAINTSQITTMTSALGTTQTTTGGFSDITKAGLGKGLSTAASELQKFYLELAKQSIPVIEVGATKTVTLVISKGTQIEVKDYKGIGGK